MYWGALFAGEFEALALLLEELSPVVEKFTLVEGRYTLQGIKRPIFWPEVRDTVFAQYAEQVHHAVVVPVHPRDQLPHRQVQLRRQPPELLRVHLALPRAR